MAAVGSLKLLLEPFHLLLPRARISRPVRISVASSFLLAALYLATKHTSVLLTMVGRRSRPSSESFWQNLSLERRNINNCPVSDCPVTTHKNRANLTAPFDPESPFTCPFYFRWIHEDLAPWRQTGISRDLLESARPQASFRIVIKNGRLFVDPYAFCYQTRAIFTIWGFSQLLSFYPALVPDLDLVFGCWDQPGVLKKDYVGRLPPPIFRYCSTLEHFDIPFPDWSFWGWPEINLRPWDGELGGIVKGATDLLWEDRDPTAFWKGNLDMGPVRKELLKCNNRGAQIIHQDWFTETRAKFANSRLAEQCRNRYKIYVEGLGWSVSLKYILACDSPVLLVAPVYYDFFLRGMLARRDYWPVRPDKLCDSIKFAVEWGNNHTVEAEAIGRAGQHFIRKEVSMKHVYDYMLHLLREYAKLLRFEPAVEGNMRELCSESFLCRAPGRERAMYEESMVGGAREGGPCLLGARDEGLMREFGERQEKMRKGVEEGEDLA